MRGRVRRPALPRALRVLIVVLAATLGLSACDFDVYKLPLPGGADVGSHPITVKADFQDVLDLVPKSTVKVDDVTVGEVTDVSLQGYHAVVTMKLRDDTKLPDNAIAEIRQTSLLGEKFVSLSAPSTDPSKNLLGNGDVIPLDHTGRNPEIEEVLGALSLVLNGGGVAQLQSITRELNKTLTGREDATRSVLTQIQTLTTNLDQNKGDIVNAIEALNTLSISVRKQEGNIDAALDELPGALKSINGQRKDLVKMLQALDQLSNVGVRVIDASKAATIDSLTQLQPVLTNLADSGSAFVDAFNVFLTYPFVDEVVGRDPQVARNLQMGDYTNLSIQLDLDLSQTLKLPTTLPTDLPSAIVGAVESCLQQVTTNGLAGLQSQQCTSLVGTQVLQQYCSSHPEQAQFCALIQTLPGLPRLGVLSNLLGGGTGGGNGGGGSGSPKPSGLPSGLPTSLPTSLPTILPSGSGGLLGGLTGGLLKGTANRAVPFGSHGPTMGQMQALFDPSLVDLLVPPLVEPSAPATGRNGTSAGGSSTAARTTATGAGGDAQ